MNNSIVKYSYVTSIIVTIGGALMKIYHIAFSDAVLSVGLTALLVFIITAIIEVNKSSKISFSEKFMWGIGFIFFSSIAGLIYIASARKRIV